MKIKKLISALVLGSMLVGLSGCNITDFSAENLLRPPKAVGDEAEIEQLIAKTADSGYTLKYPKNGKFRSLSSNTPPAIRHFQLPPSVDGVFILAEFGRHR